MIIVVIQIVLLVVSPIDRRCRVLQNNTVSCDQILYQNADAWKNHKDQLDDMIQEYRKMLEDLRVKYSSFENFSCVGHKLLTSLVVHKLFQRSFSYNF